MEWRPNLLDRAEMLLITGVMECVYSNSTNVQKKSGQRIEHIILSRPTLLCLPNGNFQSQLDYHTFGQDYYVLLT